MKRGEWFIGSGGYPASWKCLCNGNHFRPLDKKQCKYCRAERPRVTQEHVDAFKKCYPRDEFPLPVEAKALDGAFRKMQAEGRLGRAVREGQTAHYHIMSGGSLDEAVLRTLKEKKNVTDE